METTMSATAVIRFVLVLLGWSAVLGGRAQAEIVPPQVQGPPVASVDISAQGALGNNLGACRVVGQVILWVSRPVSVLDDMRESLGTIEAGLAQFSRGTRLEGCGSDGAALDLSDRFANFLVADGRPLDEGTFGRREAGMFASALVQDFYHLAEHEGTLIPLVDGVKMGAIGSVSYQFVIVLIGDAKSASFDAVVYRETVRTKFSPRLNDGDRRFSRVKWSSIP
jgi:hypothetical protein